MENNFIIKKRGSIMKILITGGAGFIGSHVANYYAERGNEIIIIDNLSRAKIFGLSNKAGLYNLNYLKNKFNNIKFINGDIRDFNLIKKNVKDVDVIIHTAAQVAVTTSIKDPRIDFEINALGTFNILEAARLSNNNPTIIFCSTNKVYGSKVNKIPIRECETRYCFSDERFLNGIPEDFPIDLCEHSPYGCSKLVGDLYAQDYAHTYGLKIGVFRMSCLTPDTKIYLNNSIKTIKDIKECWKKERVLTYDINNKKLKYSPIKTYIVNSLDERKVLEIIVESGKRIKATEDHLFYTKNGWKPLGNIKPGDYVATYPSIFEFSEKAREEIILDEACIRRIASSFLKRKAWIEWVINRLKELDLLPLSNLNKKLPIIARLIGFLLGDGWLSIHIDRKNNTLRRQIGFIGKEKDLESIREDIIYLGFSCKGKITTRHARSNLTNGRIVDGNVTKLICTSSALWFLLYALGAPVGDKSNQETYVPKWIFKSPLNVKREFLAGFMGAEMLKPTWCFQKGCFQQPIICIRKLLSLKDSGIKFAKQLSKLFMKFGVKCKIKIAKSYKRKDGRQTIGIYLVFPGNRENILKLCRIGFRYSLERQAEANVVIAYIEYILKSRLKRGVVPYHVWRSKKIEGLEGTGLIWEKVKEVRPYAKNVKYVYDLTINPTHNFIANGFLVHNCIYGERQFGVEDQGWIAWFTIATLTNKPITIYGDGKQVRDVLYISDLIEVYDAFINSNLKHEVFNIGGGPENTLSLIELINLLKELTRKETKIFFDEWRIGDQKVYISNISRAYEKLGWKPKINPREGVKKIVKWIEENISLFK